MNINIISVTWLPGKHFNIRNVDCTLLYLILELYSWLRIIFQFQFFSKTIENNSKYSSSSVSVTVNIWSLTPYVWATSGWIEWITGPTPSCLSVCRSRDKGNPPLSIRLYISPFLLHPWDRQTTLLPCGIIKSKYKHWSVLNPTNGFSDLPCHPHIFLFELPAASIKACTSWSWRVRGQ